MKYDCMKPEWADKEPCPLDTGELENCAECVWAHERETEDLSLIHISEPTRH